MPNLGLADWQMHVNGITIGPGTNYDYTVEGLFERPVDFKTVTFTGDGEYIGRRRALARQVIFTVAVDQPDAATASPILQTFLDAWDTAGTAENLQWKTPGITNERYVVGAPGRYATPWNEDGADVGLMVVIAEFRVPMPVIRDAVTDTIVRY